MQRIQYSNDTPLQESGSMPETGGRILPGYYNSPPAPDRSEAPDLAPKESAEAVGNPQNNQEVYLGSLQASLQNNLGYFVVIEFLIGTGGLTEKEGILYAVGNNFVTLYEQETDRYIVCDLYAVKFVTFFRQSPNVRPYTNITEGGVYGGMVPRRR